MLEDEQLARLVGERIIEINRLLNDLVRIVMEKSPPDEGRCFRQAVGAVSGELLTRIANPLYRQHPALKPPEMD